MNWWNLKKNKCPQCNKDFLTGLSTTGKLMHHKCGFSITEQRYSEIVNGMVAKDLQERKNIIE